METRLTKHYLWVDQWNTIHFFDPILSPPRYSLSHNRQLWLKRLKTSVRASYNSITYTSCGSHCYTNTSRYTYPTYYNQTFSFQRSQRNSSTALLYAPPWDRATPKLVGPKWVNFHRGWFFLYGAPLDNYSLVSNGITSFNSNADKMEYIQSFVHN